MRLDDPRHGSEAGYEQHKRDGEDPCADCVDGDLRAARRRTKRKTLGYRYTLPAGDAHARLLAWRDGTASLTDISVHTGLDTSVITRMLDGGPDQPVYARTYLAVMQAPATFPLTTIGTTRRVRALARLGWSRRVIAERSGVHHDTILDACRAPQFLGRRVREQIAAAYDEMHMQLPPRNERYAAASATRTQRDAEARGWLPPLAWDDIDDGREQPAPACGGKSRPRDDVDPSVVDRIVHGEYQLHATPAERALVCEAWLASGRHLVDLERATGWNANRYRPKDTTTTAPEGSAA